MGSLEIWLHGLGAAFIGGGASGIIAAQVAMGIDPNTFNYSQGLGKMAKMGGIVFLVTGAMSAFAYLKASPLPASTTTTTVTATVESTTKNSDNK